MKLQLTPDRLEQVGVCSNVGVQLTRSPQHRDNPLFLALSLPPPYFTLNYTERMHMRAV